MLSGMCDFSINTAIIFLANIRSENFENVGCRENICKGRLFSHGSVVKTGSPSDFQQVHSADASVSFSAAATCMLKVTFNRFS